MGKTAKRRAVTVSETIKADPETVWNAVADLTRMGEWSPECTGGEWVGQPAAPVVGARFRGSSKRGFFTWRTMCTITEADPGKVIAWKVDLVLPVAVWSYRFTPTEDGTGTLVEQAWEDRRSGFIGTAGAVVTEIALRTGPRGDHNERTMRRTLAALKAHLEHSAVAA